MSEEEARTEERSEKRVERKQERKDTRKETRRDRPKSRAEDNVIFVGKKPTMSYVLAVVTQFSDGCKEVHLKARGRSISHAVDIAEVVKNRFFRDMEREVEIGTEEVQDKEGKRLKVSTIDIAMRK